MGTYEPVTVDTVVFQATCRNAASEDPEDCCVDLGLGDWRAIARNQALQRLPDANNTEFLELVALIERLECGMGDGACPAVSTMMALDDVLDGIRLWRESRDSQPDLWDRLARARRASGKPWREVAAGLRTDERR